jgi:hypothetical protein
MQVGHCANDMGFQIIDEFDSLKAIARANPDEFRTYFMMHSGAFGHMSERGNRHIAELVSSSLAAAPLDRRAKDYVSSAFIPGDRQNLLPNSEAINEYVEPSPTVSIERVGGLSTEPKEYRLVAKDGSGERYLVTKSLDLPAGPYTLALDVRVNRGGGFRLKLLDVEGNGVVGDFDLTNMKAQATPLRVAQGARAGISDVGDGFYRVSLGANLPGKDTKIFFELNGASDGADSSGVPESYHIRAVQLEYGQSATAYRASIRSSKPNIVGDGHNLVARVGPWEKFLVGTSTASFASAEDENSYRVSASGGSGEHYLVSQVVELEPGPHVLSLEVRPEASSHIRVQLLNANSDGAIADYDLVKRRSTAMTVGKGHEAFSDIKRLEEGWYRLQLVTEFPGGSTRMLLGLTEARGSTGFLPQGERFRVRSVAIERVR